MASAFRQRRALVALAAVFAAGIAVLVSCSFPEVSFTATPGGEGGPPDGPASEAGRDGSQDAQDARIVLDADDTDAGIVKDAGQKVDASGCDPADCDCDKDGYKSTGKAGCNAGKNDCDDHDTRAHPDQGFLVDPAEMPLFGDWDCDGTVEMRFKNNISCTSLAPGPTTCDAVHGYEGTVACGGFANVVYCKTVPDHLLGLTKICEVGAQQNNQQQACK